MSDDDCMPEELSEDQVRVINLTLQSRRWGQW